MPGIGSILDIAKGALITQQKAMTVTSHNIANVNTPGYSRQSALLESIAAPSSSDRIQIGMGVRINSVVQYVDQFINRSISQETSSLNENESKATILSQIEAIFSETTDQGLSQLMNEFWSAWQDVSNNPGGTTERTALLEKAELLSEQFNSLRTDLTQIKSDMNVSLQASIEELNSTSQGIAELNEKITAAESSGTTANDLRDQRTQLIEKISELVGNVYLEDNQGSLTVLTSNGIMLVDGSRHWELSQDGDNIYWNNIQSDISKRLVSGKIGAYLDVRDDIVPEYIANLDELAGTIIYQVNDLHYSGFGLNDSTGLKTFFVPNPGDDYGAHTPGATFAGAAGYIALSSDVKGNPANIAAAGLSGGASGDNENSLKISALQTDETLQIRKWLYENRGQTISSNLETGTIGDYYQALTGDIGLSVQEFTQKQDYSQALLDNLSTLRDSVSGVNLDEEMTELMEIQAAYQAAAKLVTVTDEMLQSLFQIT
jgi:flagellar hook-associated protein 1 FlgK